MGRHAAEIIQKHHSLEANIKLLSEIIDTCVKRS